MEICDKIKQVRKNNNLSQEQFAEEIGVSRQSVVKYEKGVTVPLTDVLIRICQKFNLSLDYFVNDKVLENEVIKCDTVIKKEPILKRIDTNFKREVAKDKAMFNLKKFGSKPLAVLISIAIIFVMSIFVDYAWLILIPFTVLFVVTYKRFKKDWYIEHFEQKQKYIMQKHEIPLSPQYEIYMELKEDGIYIFQNDEVMFYCEYEDYDHHDFIINNQTVGEYLPTGIRLSDLSYIMVIYLKSTRNPYTIYFQVFYTNSLQEMTVGIYNRKEYLINLNNVAKKLKQIKENNSR